MRQNNRERLFSVRLALAFYPPKPESNQVSDRSPKKRRGIKWVGLNRADLSPGLGNFALFNEHLCPCVGKTRLAKNTYGPDFHLLSAGLIGHVTCSLRILLPLYGERDCRRNDPALLAFKEDLMRDFWTILMASLFVLFSLIVLLSVASTPDRTSSTLDNDQQRVSDLGLRFVFKR
jgi:hypothetical protein